MNTLALPWTLQDATRLRGYLPKATPFYLVDSTLVEADLRAFITRGIELYLNPNLPEANELNWIMEVSIKVARLMLLHPCFREDAAEESYKALLVREILYVTMDPTGQFRIPGLLQAMFENLPEKEKWGPHKAYECILREFVSTKQPYYGPLHPYTPVYVRIPPLRMIDVSRKIKKVPTYDPTRLSTFVTDRPIGYAPSELSMLMPVLPAATGSLHQQHGVAAIRYYSCKPGVPEAPQNQSGLFGGPPVRSAQLEPAFNPNEPIKGKCYVGDTELQVTNEKVNASFKKMQSYLYMLVRNECDPSTYPAMFGTRCLDYWCGVYEKNTGFCLPEEFSLFPEFEKFACNLVSARLKRQHLRKLEEEVKEFAVTTSRKHTENTRLYTKIMLRNDVESLLPLPPNSDNITTRLHEAKVNALRVMIDITKHEACVSLPPLPVWKLIVEAQCILDEMLHPYRHDPKPVALRIDGMDMLGHCLGHCGTLPLYYDETEEASAAIYWKRQSDWLALAPYLEELLVELRRTATRVRPERRKRSRFDMSSSDSEPEECLHSLLD